MPFTEEQFKPLIKTMDSKGNVVELFLQAANLYPNRKAIVYKKEAISFAELENQMKSTALKFREGGVQKGDRVLMLIPMSIDLYRNFLALLSIGATVVFMDEWVGLKRLEECCRLTNCKAMVCNTKGILLRIISAPLRHIPLRFTGAFAGVPTNDSDFELTKMEAEDSALITFTTGSTGLPKAAIRTHPLLFHQFEELKKIINPRAGDVDMPVLPIVLLINLAAGITSVIANFNAAKKSTLKPVLIAEQIKTYKINSISCSPYFLKELSKFSFADEFALSEVKKIATGGAPVFPTDAQQFIESFPNADIRIIYGSTEAEPISSLRAEEICNRTDIKTGLVVGHPVKEITVKILSVTSEALPAISEEQLAQKILAQGEIGEIIVKGKHVLKDYYNSPEALRYNKIFVNGECWHRTGDSGFFNSDGLLFLTGRCSMLIHTATGIISPFTYERFFGELENVETGTVLKVNNKITGVVESKKGINKAATISAIKKSDPRIIDIVFLKKIPRDNRHHSKIDYEKLKEIVR